MADQKISQLVSITGANIDDTADFFVLADMSNADNKKVTREELFKSVSALSIIGAATIGDGLTTSGDVDFSGVTNKSTVRSDLGLGDAATKTVQSSPTDTTSGKVVTTVGARTAASSHHGGYYTGTSGVNIDTVTAGFVGLVHDGNSGTWPVTPSNAFVWVDTQAIFSGDAVLQTAVYGYGSASPGQLKSYRRIRANSGGAWSAWVNFSAPESGSNSNGEYVRFADGTQICTHSKSVSVTTSATGSIYNSLSDFGTWTFPAPYTTAPEVVLNAKSSSVWANATSVTATQVTAGVIWSATSLSSASRSISAIAVGRWF